MIEGETPAAVYGSLKLIADANNACNFDEFLKGLKWLASQDKPCKGCRFGGGWSWWRGCPVCNCCIPKGVDPCYQREDFPCKKKLREEPLLERKKAMIKDNNQIKTIEIESYMQLLKRRYRQAATT